MTIRHAIVDLFQALFESFRTRRKTWILIGVALILAVVGFWEYANSPTFCGGCHNMDAYYQSWQKDKHFTAGVGCADCHLPPGFMNHLKYKVVDGMISGVFFVTGKGPSKASAHVVESSCTNCHPRETMKKKGMLTFIRGIQFDHNLHLTELVEGINPECTTCHRAISQETHMEVGVDVCIRCHHGQGPSGDCSYCHNPKGNGKFAGVDFSHADLKKGCTSCHNVQHPTGIRPKEMCVRCHAEHETLDNAVDKELKADEMHALHTNNRMIKHKVECYDCHGPMKPRAIAKEGNFLHKFHLSPKVGQSCKDCHSGKTPPECSDCH